MRIGAALALVFAVLIGGIVSFAISSDRAVVLANAHDRMAAMSHLVAVHAESAIEDADKVLLALGDQARSWDFQEPELREAILRRARRLMEGSPQLISFWITDATGENRLTTLPLPPGRTIPNNSGRAYFKAHADPVIDRALSGETEPGPVSNRRRFVLSRALRDADGSLVMVLAVGIATDYFAALYDHILANKSARVALRLATGEALIPARPEPFSPQHVAEITHSLVASPIGAGILRDPRGVHITAWHSSEHFPGLIAVASETSDVALGPWRQRALLLGALALISFLMLGGAVLIAFRMLRLQGEARLNETLFREVHHRVKNSLQMVTSLLRLNSSRPLHPEARAEISTIGGRIRAISSVHDLLHSSPALDLTDIAELGRILCRHLSQEAERPIAFTGDQVVIDSRLATTLAIVLNELVTNALKHCATGVQVSCRETGDVLEFVIADDGPGMPAEFDVGESSRFGLRMAHQLVDQLQGRIESMPVGAAGGTRLRVTMKLPPRRTPQPGFLAKAAFVGEPELPRHRRQ
jgi:two-component system, sensor histidine kinase PdtaS